LCLGSSHQCLSILLVAALFAAQADAIETGNSPAAATNDTLMRPSRNLNVTPYVGGSTLVGNVGLELQYENYGFNIGILISVTPIDNILCGGVRYYFRPRSHSWTIGFGVGVALDEPSPDEELCGPWSGDVPEDWVCNTGSVIDMYIGAGVPTI